MKDKDTQLLEEAYGQISKEKYFADLLEDIAIFARDNSYESEVNRGMQEVKMDAEELYKNLMSVANFLRKK